MSNFNKKNNFSAKKMSYKKGSPGDDNIEGLDAFT